MQQRVRKAWRWFAVALAVVVVPLTACDPADVPGGHGLTPADAGASCWGIKQAFPDSADGIYWLATPALPRPTEFYCDMTTDGGGWVLVARGRDGWNFRDIGQGTPATVRSTVSGSGAFAPAALPSTTIDQLLDHQPVSSLPDGIRVRRATNTSGTSTQDVRLFATWSAWTWALPVGQRLSSVRINGTDYSNGNTRDTSSGFWDYPASSLQGHQGTSRLRTEAISDNEWRQGFGYGSGVSGSSSSSSHVWRPSWFSGFALPFTQVWLRPMIANDVARPAIPKQGFPAETVPPSLKPTPEYAPWGVVGLNHTGEDSIEPWNTTVNVLKVHGNRVFVGGRFTGVRQGPGGVVHPQQSLAAFDLDGNWIASFDPQFAGRVWDLTFTDDGKLIVGGDFTSVDGLPDTSGIVALDPLTGDVITSWKGSVTHTNQNHIVRGLDHHDGQIYAAGRFNRVTGGDWNQITVSSAINLSAHDGQPGTWKPILSGTAVRVRAADAGDRVYLAGYFNNVSGDANHGYFAITDPATGNPVPGMGPWIPSTGSNNKYQQAVAEHAGQLIIGGSEHSTQWYDRDRTSLLDAHITRPGGDSQAIEALGGWVYVGCHCTETLFAGTNSWTSPNGFRSVHPINLVARFDPVTHDLDTSWYPHGLRGVESEGVWTIDQDSRGCVWVGGDLIAGSATGSASNDWLGGFGRFCPTDATAPSAPGSLQGVAGLDSVTVSWYPSSDDTGVAGYDVYRNNRVIATVGGLNFTDTEPVPGSRYTVRAFDAAGNRSASPVPVKVAGPVPPEDYLSPFGAEWSWYYQETAPEPGWTMPAYDTTTWNLGIGQFGFGDTPKATIISAGPTPRPLTSYYRRVVTIDDPTAFDSIRLDLVRNSGAVVYVNGVEVARSNMPEGAITHDSFAAGPVPTAERHVPVTYQVPAHHFVAGENLVAVELHLNSRNQATAGFDLAVIATG